MKAAAVLMAMVLQATTTVQSGSESHPTSSSGAHHTMAEADQLEGAIQLSCPEPAESLVSTGLEDNVVLIEGTLRNNGADVDEVVPLSDTHACNDLNLFHQYVGVICYLRSPTPVFPEKLSSVITRQTPNTGQYIDAYSLLAHGTSATALLVSDGECERLRPLALAEMITRATSILSNVFRDMGMGMIVDSEMLSSHVLHREANQQYASDMWMRIVDLLQCAEPSVDIGTRWTDRDNGEFIIDSLLNLLDQCNWYQSKYKLPKFRDCAYAISRMRTHRPPILLERCGINRRSHYDMENAFNMENPQVAAYIAFSGRYHQCVGNYLDDDPSVGLINVPPVPAASRLSSVSRNVVVSHNVEESASTASVVHDDQSVSSGSPVESTPAVLMGEEPTVRMVVRRRAPIVSSASTPKRPRVDLDDDTSE